jgi:polysaccharide pyruvyl transferase WcaK-like protein
LQRALYIGWTGYGNLGDEAMLEVCKSRLSRYHWVPFEAWNGQPHIRAFAGRALRSPTHFFKSLADEIWSRRRVRALLKARKAGVASVSGRLGALLGGGTLINATDEFLEQYRTAREILRHSIPVFSCGAKTPDFFAGKGSWRDRSREWVEATSDVPLVGVRGPLTKEFLDAAGARNVNVTGDPAVWLHQPLPGHLNRTPNKPFKIGINCGSAKFIWGSMEQLIGFQAQLVQRLVAAEHKVELFAISPEDMPTCQEVARQANVGIAPVPEPLTSYASYAAKLKQYDVVIAVKLHAGVLAACANVPFVMLEYQPKCRDFCLSIHWGEYNIRTDQASPNAVLERAEHLLQDLPARRRLLCRYMCDLRNAFENYCMRLEEMLATE